MLRIVAVTRLAELSRSTIYRLVAQGRFPLPVQLASRAVASHRSDLERWRKTPPLASRFVQSPPPRVQGGRALREQADGAQAGELVQSRLGATPTCPHCQGRRIVRNGQTSEPLERVRGIEPLYKVG